MRRVQWECGEPSEHWMEHRKTKITCKTNRYSPVKHNHVNHYMFRSKKTINRPPLQIL